MTDLSPPPVLRAAIAADLAPIRQLPPPMVRVLWLTPLAVLLLVAAPVVFEFRDLRALGWLWSWGASLGQLAIGLVLAAAALHESVPGRSWSGPALTALVAVPLLMVLTITFGTWHASPVLVAGQWSFIALLCLVLSMSSALPASVLVCVLALRAFPTRPAAMGLLAGLSGGVMADAGWRLFCHFSEPAHVLLAHLGGIAAAGILGAVLTPRLAAPRHR